MAEIKMRDLESLKWIGIISLSIVKINQSINVLIKQSIKEFQVKLVLSDWFPVWRENRPTFVTTKTAD